MRWPLAFAPSHHVRSCRAPGRQAIGRKAEGVGNSPNDISGQIQNGNQQDDCLFDTDGDGAYDSRCFEWIIVRGPNSSVESVQFFFGKGNCNGEVDAGLAELNSMCLTLGTGGPQNNTGPIFFAGTDTIRIFVCDNSSGQVSLCDFCTVLPVELIKFDVAKSGNSSLVGWTTAMEINNDYFEILRAGADKIFTAIGRVEGVGNTNSVTDYIFVDRAPLQGINYYKLRQFDLDGRSEYSPMKSLAFNEHWLNVKVRPTIVETELYVEIETVDPSSEVSLIDLTGRIVVAEKVSREDFITRLDLGQLSSGTYVVQVKSGVQTYQERIVIIH